MEPFAYVTRMNLIAALQKMGLESEIPTDGDVFDRLVGTAWSQLQPWPGTADALRLVAGAYTVAPLSNGDADTLRNATDIFQPEAGLSGGCFPRASV